MTTWLHLFSSNIRPLYEQDVIDLLAAPGGSLYRFRYEHKYLGDAGRLQVPNDKPAPDHSALNEGDGGSRLAPDEGLYAAWRSNALVDMDVVTYYSIQQPEGYHPAAFIPIRCGKVRRTGTDGSICFVEFEVGNYAALSPAETLENVLTDHSSPENGAVLKYGDYWRKLAIRAFSDKVRGSLLQHPDSLPRGRSAVVGPSPIELASEHAEPHGGGEDRPSHLEWKVVPSNDAAAWQLIVEALARTLSFRDELMLRFVSICPGPDGADIVPDDEGAFRLRGGRTYELKVSHYHPSPAFDVTKYQVSADAEIIRIIGSSEISIGSRYDTKTVALHAPSVQSIRETVLRLEPTPEFAGAVLQLRIRVERDISRTVAVAAGTASALALVALPGILGTSVTEGVRIALAVAGAGLAAFLAAFGLGRT